VSEKKRKALPEGSIIYIILAILTVFFGAVMGTRFLSMLNIMNILRQTAMISVMSVGMTFVLSTGEIDLSVGSTIALAALVSALGLNVNTAVGVAAGITVGLVVGLFNGAIVAWVGIPSFLVTLGSASILAGLARWVTDLKSVAIVDDWFIFVFGSGDVGPVPVLFLWTLAVMAAGYVLLNKTTFGKQVLATGGNAKAAYYTGINTRTIKLRALLLSSTTAALAGMLYAGRLHGARYTMGEGYDLSVIAATVLGGTSLFGGKGAIIGSVVGSIVIGVINNGLILMGLSVAQQMFFKGVLLLVAISINVKLQSRQEG
jgi:ribose transport system permease protein